MKLAGTRLKHHFSRTGLTKESPKGPVWTGEVRFNDVWLDQPLRWSRPRNIFVCAHADLFHQDIPDDWRDQIFAVMALSPQHTFQVLTKRADIMRRYLSDPHRAAFVEGRAKRIAREQGKPVPDGKTLLWPLANVHLGVSVENQDAANERIPQLLETPAALRWISAEPLLGPVDFVYTPRPGKTWDWLTGELENASEKTTTAKIDWVVCGGESQANARPMHPSWARRLRDQCATARTPFLFKQWGAWTPVYADPIPGKYTGGGIFLRPNGRHGSQGDWWEGKAMAMELGGAKSAQRLLDGQIHDGYPQAVRPVFADQAA